MGLAAASRAGQFGAKVRSRAGAAVAGTRERDPGAARGWERASSFRREPDKRVTFYYRINGSIRKESLAVGSRAGVLTAAQRARRKRSGPVTATPGRGGLGPAEKPGGPRRWAVERSRRAQLQLPVRVVGALRCPSGRQVGGPARELGSGKGGW